MRYTNLFVILVQEVEDTEIVTVCNLTKNVNADKSWVEPETHLMCTRV